MSDIELPLIHQRIVEAIRSLDAPLSPRSTLLYLSAALHLRIDEITPFTSYMLRDGYLDLDKELRIVAP